MVAVKKYVVSFPSHQGEAMSPSTLLDDLLRRCIRAVDSEDDVHLGNFLALFQGS